MRWKIGKIIIVLIAIFFIGGQRLKASEISTIIPYELEYSPINGEQEYLTVPPVIRVKHKDERYITKYSLTKENQEKISGELTTCGEEIIIAQDLFGEGDNQLEIWMEDLEEQKVEEYQTKKIFKIDTRKPNILLYEYEDESEQDLIICNEKKQLVIKSEDETSGIYGIFYQLEEGEEQFVESTEVLVEIPVNYRGAVTSYSVDRAGNRTDKIISKEFICENQKPNILLKAPNGFDKWYNEDIQMSLQISDTGVSAGIEWIRCYVNSEMILDKHIKNIEATDWSTSVLLNKTSINSEAIVVVVEVMDRAGNSSKLSKSIYLDKQVPVVSITGFTQHLITAQPIEAIFTAFDENKVASISTKIQWQHVDGTITFLEEPAWCEKDNQQVAVLKIDHEGCFQLEMTATDMAGNISTVKMQVIIDKTSPVIKYVDKLHKTYIKEFQWDYKIEELVEDDTSYSYSMKLDGFYYQPGDKVTIEGIHTLQLHATDAAGNQAEAKAEFIIDHTKPNIIVEHIEDGKTYERGTTVSIKLENSKDILDKVYINNEKQKLNQGNYFQYIFQNANTYEIAITAKDLAGNKAEAQLIVEIIDKKPMAQKIIDPFVNLWNNKPKMQRKTEEKPEEKIDKIIVAGWVGLIGVITCSIIGIIIRHKKTLKREDAK